MKYLSSFLSWRYLSSKRVVFLSLAAVAMSCCLLVTVSSLFTGFINALEKSATKQMGDIILNSPGQTAIPKWKILAEKITLLPLIDSATGVINSQGLMLINKGNVRAVSIWGIDIDTRKKVAPFHDALLKQKNADNINFDTIGPKDQLKGFVSIGLVSEPDEKTDEYDFDSAIQLTGEQFIITAASPALKKPASMRLIVADIMFTGIYDLDKHLVFVPIDQLAKKIYPQTQQPADMLQIKIKKGADLEKATQQVTEAWIDFAENTLGWSRYLASMAKIESAKKMQELLISEYRKQMKVLLVIFGIVSAGIVLLVFCIFYMIVMTKRKDMAIIKSCGMGPLHIASIFIIFGLVIGLAGSALGVAAGYLICHNIEFVEQTISSILGIKIWKSSTYLFTRIPTTMNWHAVAWIVTASISASVAGSLIPAFSAAKVEPVKILRYE